MLFKNTILKKIVAGKVTLAFRRWTKPTVKPGSLLHTAVGLITISDMKKVSLVSISEKDAVLAGYDGLATLKTELQSRPNGDFYRIQIRFIGADPRISLREKIQISTLEKDNLLKRISNLDQRSPRGPWVKRVLQLIQKNSGVRAAELAQGLGLETLKFKTDVRKLKNLGLTISLGTGYKISPRGRMILKSL